MVREAEVGVGVVVADVSDELVEELVVVREFSVFDILADDVAEDAAEILVSREGEEGTRIGEHADEVGEEANGGEDVDLVFHAFDGVIKPPAGAELDLGAEGRFLEGAAGGCEDGVVTRVEIIDDGLGEFVDGGEGIEEGEEGFALGPVADGIESRVWSELGEHAGVRAALGAEVELHGPAALRIPLADVKHDECSEGIRVCRGGGSALAS